MDESTDFLHFLACSIDVVALVVGQVAKPLELHEQITNFTYSFFCLPSCHHYPILHPEGNSRAANRRASFADEVTALSSGDHASQITIAHFLDYLVPVCFRTYHRISDVPAGISTGPGGHGCHAKRAVRVRERDRPLDG